MSNANKFHNFMGIPEEFSSYQNSKIVILPIPFDKTCSWLSGTSKGPQGIIEASCNLELLDIETQSEVYRQGIFTAPPVLADTSEQMNNSVYAAAKMYLADGKFVVGLGGEHAVSYGTIKAHAEKYPSMGILQLDAHTDMRESYEGNKFSHACIMARSKEIVSNIVQVGIRSVDKSELPNLKGSHIFYAEKLRQQKDWIQEASSKLNEEVYITLDVDVFDIGIMSSTGTPEPGGLGWYEVLDLLRHVCKTKKVVGFDIVELAPSEHNRAPDFMTAKLVYKMLTYIFEL